MLHPSYTELIDAVNHEAASDEVVQSRYSIVIAAAKRARQLVEGCEPLVEAEPEQKTLSIAIEELRTGMVKILSDEEHMDEENL